LGKENWGGSRVTELEKLAINYARAVDNLDKVITALGVGVEGLDPAYKRKLYKDYEHLRQKVPMLKQILIVHVSNNYKDVGEEAE
jgi:hypothetical protein